MTAKKPKSEHKKSGQPTKYNAEVRRVMKILANKGMTDIEMAEIIGVTDRTINNWKEKHPKFFQSLIDWKDAADHKVVRSLYERAHGYEHPETKAQYVQGHMEGDKWVDGKWETLDMIKHYPPDPTSMIFWLKNRDKENWRDQAHIKLGTEDDLDGKTFEELKKMMEDLSGKHSA